MKKLLSLMLCAALLLSMCPLAALAEEANASAPAVIVEAEDNAEAVTPPAAEEAGDNEDVTAPDEAEKDVADSMPTETEPANEAENIAEEEIALYDNNEDARFQYYIYYDQDTGERYTRIDGCTNYGDTLIIPDTLAGYPVKRIGYRAFCDRNLKSVIIPDSVVIIDEDAFGECTNLSNVTLSKNLVTLGKGAFESCTALKTIEIPKSLQVAEDSVYGGPFAISGLTTVTFEEGTTKIPNNLFSGCADLNEVIFPETITSLGWWAFENCTALKEIKIPKSLTETYSYAGYGSADKYGEPFTGSGLTDVILEDGITKIAQGLFAGCENLTEISIPESVTEIGYKAFDGCTSLSNVKLPKNLTTLGEKTFGDCVALKEIEIPKSLTTIDYYSFSVDYGPFYGSGLEKAFLAYDMREVPQYLLDGCADLREVDIPYTVEKIDDCAFRNCASLTNIELPDAVTYIGYSAFSGCAGLTSIDLPDALTNIGSYAFKGCTGLTSIELPDALMSIGSSAFQDCTAFRTIIWPNNSKKLYLGSNAFSGCNELKEVTIPTFIDWGNYSDDSSIFYNSGLEKIIIEDGRGRIAYGLVDGCTTLKEVVLPSSVTSIGGFSGCSSLQTINMENVKDIESSAFTNCVGLQMLKLDSVKSIGSSTFIGCSNLSEVYAPLVKTIEESAFDSCEALRKVTFGDDLTEIGEKAFYNCSALESVTLSPNLQTIGNWAFRGCKSLASLTLPNSVTSLGEYAFASCTNLSKLKLSLGLDKIAPYAFYDDTALTKVEIPYSVQSIEKKAFANCDNLTEVTIPVSVTYIDPTAFDDYAKMTIYGLSGSYAETFALENKAQFVSLGSAEVQVSLDKTELTLAKGAKAELVLTVEPLGIVDTVTWRSTDETVAKVSSTGVVTAVGLGTAKIKVTVGEASAVCEVTVVQPAERISLNRNSVSLEATETAQLEATVYPNNTFNKNVTWTSDDPTIAAVDENGLVTAYKKGKATITATAADGTGVNNSCLVTVKNTAYMTKSIADLETSHPYENNCSDVWVYERAGATYLELTFDAQTNIEEDFDYLYIYDSEGNEIGKYTGTELAGQTVYVKGDTVKIKLVSDSAGNAWGFKVTDVKSDGIVYGDLNGDGEISATDVTMTRRFYRGNQELTPEQQECVDVDLNGEITAADVTIIRRYYRGVISEIPVI